MKYLTLLLSLLAVCSLTATVSPTILIYAGGPIYSLNNTDIQANIDEVKASGFTTLVCWSIHVQSNGDLHFNDKLVVSSGEYVGDAAWPGYLAQVKTGTTSVTQLEFSVGSYASLDYIDIAKLIKKEGTGPNSTLYKNFAALKDAIPDIDAIDIDDEDDVDANLIVEFSLMLGAIGYKITFCPYFGQADWINALVTLHEKQPGLVTQINLQCYEGGAGNDPVQWQRAAADAGVTIPVYPGLESEQNGGDAPDDMESQFKEWAKGGITGGWVWLYDQIRDSTPSCSDYATAVKDGLTGQ